MTLECDTTNAIIGAILQPYQYGQASANNPPLLRYGRFILARQIEVTVSDEEGLVVIKSAELGIESFAETKEAALSSFYEDFSVLYDHLASEDDRLLTVQAQSVKRAFHDIVVSVVAAA